MSISEDRLAVAASALSSDPRQATKLARIGNFVGLLFDAHGSGFAATDLSATGKREFLHVLSSQDRRLVGLRAEIGPKGFSPGADVDRALMMLDRVMDAAKRLNAPLVCVDLGPLPVIKEAAKPKPKVTPEQAGLILLPTFAAAPAPEVISKQTPSNVDPNFVALVDGALIDLGQRADRYGVTVAFRSELSPFSAIERALRRANCPWFGVDLCPVAIVCDEWEMDEIFSRLGPLIRHVRGRDAVRGQAGRTQPAIVGKGDVDWGALINRLDETGYNGWLTMDPMELPDRGGAAIAGADYLKNLK